MVCFPFGGCFFGSIPAPRQYDCSLGILHAVGTYLLYKRKTIPGFEHLHRGVLFRCTGCCMSHPALAGSQQCIAAVYRMLFFF